MKTLLLLCSLLSVSAIGRSIVPERIVTPSLDLFSNFNKTLPNGDVEVRVISFAKNGEFSQRGTKRLLLKPQYEAFAAPARAVFEMIPNQMNGDEERKLRRGTAFHIGNNLLLTNNHVLDESFQNTTECSDFQVKDHTSETYSCKRVHFCDPQNDVCLIEMAVKKKTKRDCFFCRGTKYEVSLAQGPSLKLKARYLPDVDKWQQEILTAIGNSQGWGIHLAQGRGVTVTKDRLYFWAPISKGNSGGALLNDEGLVVGVVKLQSKTLISSDPNEVYNIAAPSALVIELIREKLRDDPETLLKFNQAVVE